MRRKIGCRGAVQINLELVLRLPAFLVFYLRQVRPQLVSVVRINCLEAARNNGSRVIWQRSVFHFLPEVAFYFILLLSPQFHELFYLLPRKRLHSDSLVG